MVKTKMATETEVEGETTVSVPEEVAEGLLNENESRVDSDVPEKQTTVSIPEEGKTEKVEESTEPEEAEAQPTRKERRIGEFVDKLKTKDQEISALREQLDKVQDPNKGQPLSGNLNQQGFGMPPWQDPFQVPQEGTEVTPEKYAQDVTGAADQIVNLKLQKFQSEMKRVNDFKDDLQEVEKSYDVLNPDSDGYDKDASQKIAKMFEVAAKGDSKLRLRTFVDDFMSFRQAGRKEGMAEVTPKMARAEAEGAIPPSVPSGKQSGAVDANKMTLSEMEAYLKTTGEWDNA